jgi:hypothetical protein
MQTYDQWQQSPMQGVIVPRPKDEPLIEVVQGNFVRSQPLNQIEESLKTALPWLEQAYCLMNSNRLDKSHTELYTAICDAMTACQEACERITDTPDSDED